MMNIVLVTEENLRQAAAVHAVSWRESHRDICSAEFVAAHTTERQMDYISREMARGKRFFLLEDEVAVAVVSLQGSVIGDLYVDPSMQGKGYGTALLRFAMAQCQEAPVLWVLSTNERAARLYQRIGFSATGRQKVLSAALREIEMRYVKG